MNKITPELKEQIITYRRSNGIHATAKLLGVATSTVVRYAGQLRDFDDRHPEDNPKCGISSCLECPYPLPCSDGKGFKLFAKVLEKESK